METCGTANQISEPHDPHDAKVVRETGTKYMARLEQGHNPYTFAHPTSDIPSGTEEEGIYMEELEDVGS